MPPFSILGLTCRLLIVVGLSVILLPWRGGNVAYADDPPAPAPFARAAIVVDAKTGAVLYGRNTAAELAPASLTKMMTALVALERAPLDKPIHTTHFYDVVPVVIGLEPGDTISLENALYGLLLNSGNDAAAAIAENVGGGSTERFVGWMNETAARLGLQHTRFKNPHGLDQAGHVSSAYDMAIIGRALMQQPVLAEIVRQRTRVVEGPPRWLFQTRNPLLGVYMGVDGIKTGFDDDAGLCLVATAIRDDRRAIAVVLNSPNYGVESAQLLDYAFADQRWGGRDVAPVRPAMDGRRIQMLRADLYRSGPDAPPSLARARALTGAARP